MRHQAAKHAPRCRAATRSATVAGHRAGVTHINLVTAWIRSQRYVVYSRRPRLLKHILLAGSILVLTKG
eukprot:75854-Pleurochrysis_carterae.AAC.1